MLSTPHIDVMPAERVRDDIRVRVQAAPGPFLIGVGIVARSVPSAHAIEFRYREPLSIAHLLKAETIAKVGGHLDALKRIVETQDGKRLAAIVQRAEQPRHRRGRVEADPEPEEEE